MDWSPHQAGSAGHGEHHRHEHAAARLFGRIFGVIVTLSTMCLILNVVIALAVHEPSPQVQDLLSTLSTAWKMGFGAIVGLLGGKATG